MLQTRNDSPSTIPEIGLLYRTDHTEHIEPACMSSGCPYYLSLLSRIDRRHTMSLST
jgi:hypothetical protein